MDVILLRDSNPVLLFL